MKRSKSIKLVILTAALASCQQSKKEDRGVYIPDLQDAYFASNLTEDAGYKYDAFRPYVGYSDADYPATRYASPDTARHQHSTHSRQDSTKSGSHPFFHNIFRGGFGNSARAHRSILNQLLGCCFVNTLKRSGILDWQIKE